MVSILDFLPLVMFVVLLFLLMSGYPVAFTLGAVALLFALLGVGLDLLTPDFFKNATLRIYGGIINNITLLAVPLFVFMGMVLEKSGLAEDLLETMAVLFGKLHGGLAISIVVVGGLMAATTGVVGATVVTMTVLALPTMLKHGYQPELSTGTIAASGTLGQLLPPSVVLILLADVMGISPGELFAGAVAPGLLIIAAFIIYISIYARIRPAAAPRLDARVLGIDNRRELWRRVLKGLIPPILLMTAVLGSIFFGIATPTESAAFGALGALVLAALYRRLQLKGLIEAMRSTTRLTSMVFMILIGATTFGLVFNGLGGHHLMSGFVDILPGGQWGFLIFSMLLIFLLGFFLDFLEISFIVVPVLAIIAVKLGVDPLWFAVLIAVNLQTSFLTPPFGFSLFYLKAAAPSEISINQIYRGVVPFIIIQAIVLAILIALPKLSLWLPEQMAQLRR